MLSRPATASCCKHGRRHGHALGDRDRRQRAPGRGRRYVESRRRDHTQQHVERLGCPRVPEAARRRQLHGSSDVLDVGHVPYRLSRRRPSSSSRSHRLTRNPAGESLGATPVGRDRRAGGCRRLRGILQCVWPHCEGPLVTVWKTPIVVLNTRC